MTTIDRAFDADAEAAFLDDAEDRLYAKPNNLAFQTLQAGNEALEDYGTANDYEVEPVIQSGQVVETARDSRRVMARIEWRHRAAGLFDRGVSPHTIKGRPILSFIWENAPQSVKELFPNTERVDGDPRVFFRSVEHPGLTAARFTERALNFFRLLTEGRARL